MSLRTKPTILLPDIPPQIDNEEIRQYLEDINRAIERFVKDVYDDMSSGRVQHRIYNTVPTTTKVDEGEIVFYDDGAGTVRVYANVGGVMKYVTMV